MLQPFCPSNGFYLQLVELVRALNVSRICASVTEDSLLANIGAVYHQLNYRHAIIKITFSKFFSLLAGSQFGITEFRMKALTHEDYFPFHKEQRKLIHFEKV